MSARIWRRATLCTASLAFALPLFFLLVVSLQPEGQGLSSPLDRLLDERHFENYARALERMGDFPRLLFNTILITVLSIAGQLLCCSLAGYAFARVPFRGRDGLFLLVLATMLLPEQVTAIPRFPAVPLDLGLVDTYYPLILPTVLGGAHLSSSSSSASTSSPCRSS